MKRNILVVMTLCFCMTLTAATISKEEARQKALQFLTQRNGTAGASRRAQSMQTVDDAFDGRLYLFNVGAEGGFVVVSGDDSTPESVLGFADSGQINLDDMPENMREWLQGYADEIAWLQEHPQSTTTQTARRSAAVKKAVPPLLTSLWNQNAPFNDDTPIYDGTHHSATGCVATAMAQVMYYHKHPASPTKDIASYTWPYKNTTLGPLTKDVVFDWANMLDNYKGDYTAQQAAAVAQLMKYCGYSVEMNYRRSSNSFINKAAKALKEYYDYNPATTQLIHRKDYYYSDWIDIIYHEVANRRPVYFSGQSMGGGHAFVVDGYQGEDFFHINWGWGGTSNSYFKLSVLNPNDQGIGGSSTNEGYTYWHRAIVGIQKSSESGTVHEKVTTAKHTQALNLKLNSFTLSASTIEMGETVNVNINITNNGTTYYDNEIVVGVYNAQNNKYDIQSGRRFYLAAGETKTCTVPFKPKKEGTLQLTCHAYYNKFVRLDQDPYLELTVVKSTAADEGDLTFKLKDLQWVEQTGTNKNGKPLYNLYGNDFKGTITVTNTEDTAYRGRVKWKLFCTTSDGVTEPYHVSNVTIPAHGSIDIPIEASGLNFNDTYKLSMSYRRGGAWTRWQPQAFFTTVSAVETYNASGVKSFTKLAGGTYTSPDDALVVNVSGMQISAVTPNSQPNALYIYSGTTPGGLNGKNVVCYDGDNYTAENIQLTDGKPFFSPVDIKAQNVTFTYAKPAPAANGKNSWNTLVLPFDVAQVKADDTVIDWFRSDTDTGKDLWLKEFVSDDNKVVNFNHLSGNMKANVPCIIALSDDKPELNSKTIRFIGTATTIRQTATRTGVSGSYYSFSGNTIQSTASDIYTLSADGTQFVKSTTGSAPFRAYFKAYAIGSENSALTIGNGGTTGIREKVTVNSEKGTVNSEKGTVNSEKGTVNSEKLATAQWYTLDGRRLSGQPAQKGLYIVNGRKVAIK